LTPDLAAKVLLLLATVQNLLCLRSAASLPLGQMD
jgi:hypothetical protein